MSPWWATAGDLALESDGTAWLLDDAGARCLGPIDDGHGLDLTGRQWAAWDRLGAEWREAVREESRW